MARQTLSLRFRTKKDFAEAKKAAKEARLSLNEYIIRCVEASVSPKQNAFQPSPDNQFVRLASQAPAINASVDN